MTIDEMVRIALAETYEKREEQILTVPKKHRFSLGYRLWEYRTLKSLEKNRFDSRWTLKKARYAVASLSVAVSLMLATSVYAVGAFVGRYAFEDKTEYSKLFIENITSDKTVIEEYYGLPEEDGWEMVDCYKSDIQTVICYEQGDKKVTFQQRIINGYIANVNTENALIEPMSLYKNDDGFFIQFQKTTDIGLYWIYDGYLFTLLGNITKEEAVNLAYSIKIANF